MGSSILGGVFGGVLGALGLYEDKRDQDRQERLAREQAEAAKKAAQDEEQARRKAEQRGPDVSNLLEANTMEGLGSTSLTGARGSSVDPSRLGRGSNLLGS